MEEDIKNIEEMLEFKEDIIKYHAWVGTKLINSVENLLTRYKYLEENQLWSEATIEGLKKDFIPKSKIKEKIAELKGELTNEITRNDGFSEYREYAIDILTDVLEEE